MNFCFDQLLKMLLVGGGGGGGEVVNTTTVLYSIKLFTWSHVAYRC